MDVVLVRDLVDIALLGDQWMLFWSEILLILLYLETSGCYFSRIPY